MEIVYEKTIIDLLDDAFLSAWKHDKKIKQIILTREEYADLMKSRCIASLVICNHNQTFYDGIPLVVR